MHIRELKKTNTYSCFCATSGRDMTTISGILIELLKIIDNPLSFKLLPTEP